MLDASAASTNRRQALRSTAGLLLGTHRAWTGANDRVRLAIVGMGGRGTELMRQAAKLPNVEIGALVDPDGRRTEQAAGILQQVTQGAMKAKLESDMRRVFDDKNIDAVLIANCNHWHALSGIWACQAGKDIYVEKPVSHNLFEGGKLVEAARKYKRVAQGGTQRRSYGRFRKVIEMIHSGVIGDIYLAKWVFPGKRDSIGFKDPQTKPPAWLNWDLWVGPAPMQPYHENLVHYNWHWFWDFGNGELGNNGIHLVDIARWAMRKELPVKIYSTGGRFGYKDQAETPNTQTVTWTYADGSAMVGELRGLYTAEPMSWDFFGTKGHIRIESDEKFEIVLGRSKQLEPITESLPTINHCENFVQAVRERRMDLLTAEIRETHLSTALCHLGNISYRLGRELKFDPARNRFVADAEANQMLTRNYRKPYVVPEQV
ncbi:MAG: Gfo/Idh/MocA family oxidoreductase [Bryobacteraceae bacterium]|nr:Gfo/Idh/MocA family oxidoreductase [Bryobacteraceae bacterium]MDW8380180.1 Gfo/Idh/MocA family oxidoreductase [Bryobacterales bacterium]